MSSPGIVWGHTMLNAPPKYATGRMPPLATTTLSTDLSPGCLRHLLLLWCVQSLRRSARPARYTDGCVFPIIMESSGIVWGRTKLYVPPEISRMMPYAMTVSGGYPSCVRVSTASTAVVCSRAAGRRFLPDSPHRRVRVLCTQNYFFRHILESYLAFLRI